MNIALIAPAASGKDFLAELLIHQYGYRRYAFADNVKKVARKWFPHLYDEEKKPRWLLQMIGTMFRKIDPDIWIKALLADIDKEQNILKKYGYAPEAITITDCRMPNEYEALKKRGFTFIRITVYEEIRRQRMLDRGDNFTDDDLKHHTETFYDTFECEFEISNNGTLEELKYQLDSVMDELIKREVG
ncbi:hypothetical protein ABE073_05075 [Lederbergia citrisecunda]|uniref:hypothetical protein n=1 Tax=Lederbergia citrisecunda TaxID=2833583 RepID=UPI003D2DC56B